MKDFDKFPQQNCCGYCAALMEYLYPSETPIELQMLRCENIVIPINYLLIGTVQGITAGTMLIYLLKINASEAQQVTILSLSSLPGSFKVIFGFISDTIPIYGCRRKYYILIGWCLASLSIGSLALLNDKTIPLIALFYFLFGTGFWFADVVADSIVAEKIKYEPVAQSGHLQSFCYACRFFMLMCTITLTTLFHNDLNVSVTFGMVSIAPMILLLPSIYFFKEDQYLSQSFWNHDKNYKTIHQSDSQANMVPTDTEIELSRITTRNPIFTIEEDNTEDKEDVIELCVNRQDQCNVPYEVTGGSKTFVELKSLPSIQDQFGEVWNTMCTQAVWQPLSFVYIFAVMQLGNAAWNQYLYSSLHFTTMEINSMLIASYVLLYVGVLVYKAYLLKWSWRSIYIGCTCMNILFSIFQILLIVQWNRRIGISDYLFALGDNALSELFYGIQYLPTVIMMGQLCPKGTEGTSYALFTSINNSAIMLSSSISTSLLGIWDVSKSSLEAHHTNGLLYLTILTSCIQISAIIFIPLLPSSKAELSSLNYDQKSVVGGGIFLFIVTSSILWAIFSGVMNVVHPGWQGDT